MKIKEFLKPTIWKIIIFIILLNILVFLPVIPVLVVVFCFAGPCPPVLRFIQLNKISEYMAKHTVIISTPTIVGIIIEILILYLISCLIIFGYNKIRKKTK